MPSTDDFRRRRSQRGQTILLVAISMVSLLAMAALAIDVVTLYVARTEVQRAADAAALAGAKALADSGVTTLTPSDPNLNPDAINLAESMATSAISAVVSAAAPLNNHVAGAPPTLVAGYPTFNLTTSNNNNPRVTVVLQQTNLPTFFARIWGASASTTSATATPEAYNPSNSVGGSFTPITPRCVKPWLVANLDPTSPTLGTPFIQVATGAVQSSLPTLTSTPFFLTPDCQGAPSFCSLNNSPMKILGAGGPDLRVQYLPALVTPNLAADTCPACADTSNSFEEGTACCNAATYSCGGNANNAFWDSSINPKKGVPNPATSATECLIHATATGPTLSGQDWLEYPSPWPSGPPQISAGTNNPMSPQNVTTSSSIVTIPIIPFGGFSDTTGPVTVVGFLQAFVNYVNG